MLLMTFILFIFNSFHFLRECKWLGRPTFAHIQHHQASQTQISKQDLLFTQHNDFYNFLLTKQHKF